MFINYPLKALQVLDDCRIAAEMLLENRQNAEYRVIWISNLTLLRTVGHVLCKVDRKNSEIEVQKVIDTKWEKLIKLKPEPQIFHLFIAEERNNLLKEYRSSSEKILSQRSKIKDGELIVSFNISDGIGTIIPNNYNGVTISSSIKNGYFKGRTDYSIVKEAIQFWDEYLFEIVMHINLLKNGYKNS